jgi:hypothetical protein
VIIMGGGNRASSEQRETLQQRRIKTQCNNSSEQERTYELNRALLHPIQLMMPSTLLQQCLLSA